MAATQIRPPGQAPADGADGTGRGAARAIRPRRGLPGGRAVVGGLLVAVAAVGTFAAVTDAGKGPDTRLVVASRDISPGTILTAADLDTVAVDVPASLAGRTFTSPDQVVGAVSVGPLSEGELLQAGGLAEGDDALIPTFSIAIPQAAANGGELQRGDRVQVFANYGSDTAATLQLLAADAKVVSIESGDEAVGSSGLVEIILAITSPEERSKVLNATVSGDIALVRITGAPDPQASPSYRPDLAADTAESGEADPPPPTTAGGG